VAKTAEEQVPIAWWPRSQRYAERLAPGTKFADIIGEIDPAKLAGGTSMSAEEALHFGLIPRMHRGVFAINELPELDELVQVGLFNILEERDVQIRGYPIKFDIDVLILFSANPATYNRSGKVIPQLKDRIGSVVHTHYPRERELGIQIMDGAGGGARPGRRFSRGRAVLHARDHRGDQRRGPQVEVHRPPVGRERPVQHRQLSHDGG
jgi:magnesium chelatase subunit I